MTLRALVLLAVTACLPGCRDRTDASTNRAFTVAAAASLTDVVLEALTGWNERGESAAAATFASSSTLARQLEAGAPFDVVLVADEVWMDRLVEAGDVDPATRVALAHGRLVVATPVDAAAMPLPGTPLRAGRWTTGDPTHVPLGRYAVQAVRALGAWDDVGAALVPAADARAALRLVERGEVDWGILYRTDAIASERVRIVHELAADLHVPVTYSGAAAPGAAPAARAFLTGLAGPTGSACFVAHGFEPVSAAGDQR